MPAAPRPRAAANAAEAAALSANERILQACHDAYTHPDKGLIVIAAELGLSLLPPRKKITVMILGNHSAGKSSFINWYVEEHVLRTGVAIETQGFTFVTSGRKRESLTGNATLHLYPHFKALQEIKGVTEYLGTEISTSKQKKFSLVTFIDTPGLVDGDMKYPFDVDSTIHWLGELADLIFVFFDPMGQALCKRTLNIVERLNERQGDKLRFFLSKADEAGTEVDRQRVMMQIVQELCKRPGLNKCGFDMPTIYIPNPNRASRCVNQMEDVCRTIEKTIDQMVQTTLNTLERDCDVIALHVTQRLADDSETRQHNRTAWVRGLLYGLLALVLPLSLLADLLHNSLEYGTIEAALGPNLTELLYVISVPFNLLWNVVPEESHSTAFLVVLGLAAILFYLAKMPRTRSVLTKKGKRQLLEIQEYVREVVKPRKRELYREYLKQSVGEQDMD
ncbi:unnamed protein product [Lampetra planeri]